jgi:hypothetical protein
VDLNRKQRVILIIGAAVFPYVIFTSPKISIVKGTYITPPSDKKEIARIVDVRTAMTRAVAVLGATLLVSIALKDPNKPRLPFPPSSNPASDDCQENQSHPTKGEVAGRMIRFLKDFF